MVNDPTWIALIAYGSRPTLGVGDRSVHVTRLQRALRAAGYTTLTGTGFYGSLTVTAVKAVQRGNGIRATGIVGPKFWRLLQSGKLKPGKKVSPSLRSPPPWPRPRPHGAGLRQAQVGDGSATARPAQPLGLLRPDPGCLQGGRRQAAAQRPRPDEVRECDRQEEPKPGDLVFFYSPVRHVAIYAGNGKVIHASSPGKPVADIKMAYMPYAGARRIA